jgi:dihydrofolate reductase
MRVYVVSTTLDPAQHPDVTILAVNLPTTVSVLKAETGKDIWLMGGGMLFRCLLDAGLVDGIDIAVMPILLGSGVPFLPEGRRCGLRLNESKALSSGILSLAYSVASP